MVRAPLARVSGIATPQTRPLPGRSDQVRNAAGGYVFAKNLWTRLEDFLILGTTGGTYYVGEDGLTEDNADVLFDAINADGPRVVRLLTEISTARPPRAPKQRPALFALAACYAFGDAATRQAAKAALPRVARTTDHLSAFFGYYKNLGGKPSREGGTAPRTGRSLRTALGSWFLTGAPDDVAFKACKAMQRKTPQGEAFSLRDVLRIAHPVADGEERRVLLGWIAGNVPDEQARRVLPAVDRFLTAKAVTSVEEAVRVVTEARVPWEFLPDAMLAEPKVWDALVDTIGMTALLRNLARMTRIGALTPGGDATRRAVARLTDQEAILRARIHPMDVFLALRVYASGRSQPSPRVVHTWRPIRAIRHALEKAYELSFGAVEPSGKRLLVAVDSSGSMNGYMYTDVTVAGSRIGSPYEVACAMAVMLARIEGDNVRVIEVDTEVHPSRVTPHTKLRRISSWRPSGGGTDLSLPFTWAREQRLEVDGIVVLTDNETWAGRSHPAQALNAYRAEINPETRMVVCTLTPAGYGIGDPQDPGVLNVAGTDASLPLVVNGFIR